jgi:hypothetical protein
MDNENEARKIHIVFSRERDHPGHSKFFSWEAGPQVSLFADPKPGVVVFVRFSKVGEDEFVNVLRSAQPACIIDLRIAPRFDCGTLNRQAAFALFSEVNALYVDATTPMMMGEKLEGAFRRLRETVANIDFRRPLVFLCGSDTGSIASDSQVLELLSSAGKPAKDVYTLPSDGVGVV